MRSEADEPQRDGPTIAQLSEAELIARIRRPLPSPPPSWLVVGIGDDAAVVEPERNRLEVLSVDALVQGVHFDLDFTPPTAVGHRAMAANLSDLAAMGASPRLALLSLALPADLPLDVFDGVVSGTAALAARYGVTLAGGNLTRTSGPLVIDITIAGTVKRRQVLTRAGARPGDDLYVTGTIGTAAAGLQALRTGRRGARTVDGHASTAAGAPEADVGTAPITACVERYLYPDPRVRTGLLLGRNRAASACLDLSDGLAAALRQLVEASTVGAAIDASAIPIDPEARGWFERHGADPVLEAVAGGDDYELLFAVRPRTRGRLAAARRHGVPITRIGRCTAGGGVHLQHRGADVPLPAGFRHFR